MSDKNTQPYRKFLLPSGPPVKSVSKPWRSILSVMTPSPTPVVEPGVQGGQAGVRQLGLINLEEAEGGGEQGGAGWRAENVEALLDSATR